MAMMRSTLIVSGAFGIFRKDVAMACGGYRAASITEDMDLVIRMQKHMHERKKPYRIQFIPDPICWTEAPESLRVLARQRSRWHRGLIQTLVRYRGMLFNPRYGVAGMFAMPFYALFEMAGPFIECLGYALFLSHIRSRPGQLSVRRDVLLRRRVLRHVRLPPGHPPRGAVRAPLSAARATS